MLRRNRRKSVMVTYVICRLARRKLRRTIVIRYGPKRRSLLRWKFLFPLQLALDIRLEITERRIPRNNKDTLQKLRNKLLNNLSQ